MPTRKKLIGAAAFAAALAGGATAGALLGTPSVSSAQDDPSSSSSDAPSTDSPSTETPAPEDCGPGHGRHLFLGDKLEAAAQALGMTVDELRAELDAGKSIAAVASEKGVDVQAVIDAIVAAATANIDQAVTDGTLTQERADELKANLVDRVTNFVNRTPPDGGFRRGHGPRHGQPPAAEDDTTNEESSGS